MDCGFVEENNLLYCECCFENYMAPVCSKCHQRIKGVSIISTWLARRKSGRPSLQPYGRSYHRMTFGLRFIGCTIPLLDQVAFESFLDTLHRIILERRKCPSRAERNGLQRCSGTFRNDRFSEISVLGYARKMRQIMTVKRGMLRFGAPLS